MLTSVISYSPRADGAMFLAISTTWLSYSSEHEDGERVVNHRLVIDRQKLLAHDTSERMESRAGASGEYDTFHGENRRFLGLKSGSQEVESLKVESRGIIAWSRLKGRKAVI